MFKKILNAQCLKSKILTAAVIIFCVQASAQDYSRSQILSLSNTYFEVSQRIQQAEKAPLLTIDTLYLDDKAKMFLCQDGANWVIFANEQSVEPIVCLGEGKLTLEYLQQSPLWFLLKESMIGLDSLRISGVITKQSQAIQTVSTRSTNRSTPLLDLNGENIWKQDKINWGSDTERMYNKYCPTFYNVSDGRTIVGCTAVAMGQVMWYNQWPNVALIPENIYPSGITYGVPMPRIYRWNLMPPSIISTTPVTNANYIAKMLRDCGYAGNMIYGDGWSAMSLTNAKSALINTFSYNVKMRHYSSGASLFNNTIKSEIAASRPVIIQATHATDGSSHTFVIDGYDSASEQFHLNLGWGAGSNLWYSVSGANCYNYYTIARRMLYQIIPNRSASTSQTTMPELSATVENNTIKVTADNDILINWSIYDVYGQKVISGRGLQADITAVPRGSYTFVAESANSKCQIKFVKK